jgi:hypothetical protein
MTTPCSEYEQVITDDKSQTDDKNQTALKFSDPNEPLTLKQLELFGAHFQGKRYSGETVIRTWEISIPDFDSDFKKARTYLSLVDDRNPTANEIIKAICLEIKRETAFVVTEAIEKTLMKFRLWI